ncbi:claspin [Malaya genurostris]|uniref:claspin n=1 Tax=Malaya genurostris TaxID=325434 RepID=UPI0026F3EB80|nr:claspin [Malaya genurostris]
METADENSNQSSQSNVPHIFKSQQELDSDSELHVDDTLRMEESDDEASVDLLSANNELTPVGENTTEKLNQNQETSSNGQTKNANGEVLCSDTIDSQTDGEDALTNNKNSTKKTLKIIDSDSEQNQLINNITSKARFSKIIDSDTDDNFENDQNVLEHKQVMGTMENKEKSMNRLKSLIDSDSDSSNKESDTKNTKRKKLKSKKEREKTRKNGAPKDLLASLNLDFSDDDCHNVEQADTNSSCGSDSNNSDEETLNGKESKSGNINSENKSQRMSAKMAMDQMKVIQSESQRMAREANIDVPYHRPKQHTLQEYLNRRMVHKSNDSNDGRKKIAAAIKMTPEELEAYAKRLEEREKEAMEFFKNETDEEIESTEHVSAVQLDSKLLSNEKADVFPQEETRIDSLPDYATQNQLDSNQNANDIQMLEVNPQADRIENSPTEKDDEVVDKTHENTEKLLVLQTEHTDKPTTPATNINVVDKQNKTVDYDIFPEPSCSKLVSKNVELLAEANIPLYPTLHGSPNMVIDLDSGDVVPQAPTGAAILLERFAKCSGKKSKKNANLNILSTDKGTIQMDTIVLPVNPDDRDPNGKEPVPGASFMKLRQSLREKMEQSRREAFLKRQMESQQAKQLDDDEEEEDEILDESEEFDCQTAVDDDDEEKVIEQTETTEKNVGGLIDDEADEIDSEQGDEDDEENEESNVDDDDSSSENEPTEQIVEPGTKKKSRIIAAFVDSDDDDDLVSKKMSQDKQQASTEATTEKDELLTTLEDTNKFTASDRENLESGDTIKLLWKDTDEPVTATQADDDLLDLCSGSFGGVTQVPSPLISASQDTKSINLSTGSMFTFNTQSDLDDLLPSESKKTATDALFTQHNDKNHANDDELMALCSGTFTTQRQSVEQQQNPEGELPNTVVSKGKLVLASSDEENDESDSKRPKKRKQKKRTKISDDEESLSDDDLVDEEFSETNEPVEPIDEDEAERFVDYDSEENEVEVVMTKKDKQKVANAFLENEAELSESEWGSADEDEKDLDRYDLEVGDEEKFDQNKLHEELERIHARRMLEQDKKEVKTLQEIFFEDEEKDGIGRERQFRWRNVETTFSLDYNKEHADEDNADEQGGSDNETELQWRKLRHERELLLKEKKVNLDEVNFTTLLDKTFEDDENNSSVNNTMTSLGIKKKITIVRTKKTSDVITPKDSPFLITKSSIVQGHKASFLSRDNDTLNKLASLVKVPDVEGTSTVNAAKGRNFVFAAVSPAVDKTGTKRSLDAETDDSPQNTKKVKTGSISFNASVPTKKRLLLEQLI